MEENSDVFKKLFQSIQAHYGYDFTDYHEASLKRRSILFMDNHRLNSLDELGALILRDEYLCEKFIQYISIPVTEMFRDPLFYYSLREKIILRLATYTSIKIWIAGCATGEEAYSVAILLKEKDLLDRSIIYATDINQQSLQVAREGIYPLGSMKLYTGNYLKAGGEKAFSEYYTAKYNYTILDQSLKHNIIFAPHNLAVDQPFNEFHFIVCRNVLIYFNQQLQNKVINLFYDSLCSSGFLGLGSKESLLFTDKNECFEEVDHKEKLYRKT
ncbi:CheR family methyltransferase [Ohtaekwangia koreensis]|uniref:Chemotaxis protein methyltransferase CheR n=1 Tax=Ohtaekwangia koreensis TaxID=688867 RepID=A0A1T5MFZ5_9BACT|nr:protein-glutamate O-methyltransferase CheR [Ohtaekwangia koreensis]SKC87095.1 chemotaxis protein methyltransferase CheR [Ohtaekwangia koreensis]